MRPSTPCGVLLFILCLPFSKSGICAALPEQADGDLDVIAVEYLIDEQKMQKAQSAETAKDAQLGSDDSRAADRRVIEEIIVTAQKKEESIRDVPMSVMALSEDFITEKGISDMNVLSAYTPNVRVDVTPTVGFVSMRGLGSGTNKGVEQSVGLVIDGVFYSRLDYISNGLMDLSRIEVLRGPQGTLRRYPALSSGLI